MHYTVLELVLSPLSILSAFFYSIIRESEKKHKALTSLYNLTVNIIYALLTSIYLGFILSAFISITIATLTHWDIGYSRTNIIGGFSLIFILLMIFVLRNIKSSDLNLPEKIINSLVILM